MITVILIQFISQYYESGVHTQRMKAEYIRSEAVLNASVDLQGYVSNWTLVKDKITLSAGYNQVMRLTAGDW